MAKHIHIHFAPRKARDQAPGSVPQAVSPHNALVDALLEAIAARQGTQTQDAENRDPDGKFAASPSTERSKHTETARNASKASLADLRAALHYHHYHAMTSSNEGTKTAARQRRKMVEAELKKRGHKTTDAGEWQEHKHPRAAGGQFTSGQHAQAAKNHEDAANAHTATAKSLPMPLGAGHAEAAELHMAAAEAHNKANKHIMARTGLGGDYAQQAHNATFKAAKASGMAETSADPLQKMKQLAADPKTPIAQRAAAVEALAKHEKMAEAVASSSYAIPQPATASGMLGLNDPTHPANTPMPTTSGPSTGQRDPGAKFAGAMAANKGGSGSMESQAAKQPPNASAAAPSQPAGAKPTSATAKATKAATHELLSSGHPFSVDELMKATGCNNRTTLMTAISDLKSPKYAGKLGALSIEKTPDGMFQVKKAGGTPAPAASAGGRAAGLNQENSLPPSIAGKKDEGSGTRTPNAPHTGGSTTGFKPYNRADYAKTASAEAAAKGAANMAKPVGGTSPTQKPAMNVDPISYRTSMAGGVPHRNSPAITSERAAANAKHMAGLEAARKPAGQSMAPKPLAHASGTGQTFLPAVPNASGAPKGYIHPMSKGEQSSHAGHTVGRSMNGSYYAKKEGVMVHKDVPTYTELKGKLDGAAKPASQSMAQIAQGLIKKGEVKPGSTTPAPGTAPKPGPDSKPAKHTPLPAIHGGGQPGQYTSTPAKHREESHTAGIKFTPSGDRVDNVVPARKIDIHHNGEHIGHVESYLGYKDGPKINAAGVVAWRKPAVQYKYELKPGHKYEPAHGHAGVSSTHGFSSMAEATRALQRAHYPKK